ncbi:MAG: hypothetical protein KF812_00830 [Fimbriimonadaceae bacterium]|nr:hypothetical protein [Fimbriimonadaceae bacterium]
MSVTLRMASDQVQVEPGSTVALALEIQLTGDESDRFELTVEGLDPAWVAVPEPTFEIVPGELSTQRVFFKPSRESESIAGSYPFVVQVRSLNTGEARTQQGILVIKQFHHLTADLTPRRAQVKGTGSEEPNFRVAITNLGNVDEVLHLSASDNEGNLACEFADEQVMVSPGQTIALPISVRPKKKATLAATRLHTFTVMARSVDQPAVGASTQGHLEQKAIISPSILASLIVFAGLIAAWFLMMPKPPKIVTASVSPATVEVGMPVDMNWKATNAETVELVIGEVTVSTTLDPVMPSYSWTPEAEGTYDVSITPVKGEWKGQPWRQTITVSERPKSVAPDIMTFDIQPRRVKVGDSYQISYRVNDAVVKLSLSPIGRDLDPKGDGVRLQADLPGQFDYKLTATNADGESVTETIRIEFFEGSDAAIVAFKASALEVEPGTEVTLEWTVTETARLELSHAGTTQTLTAATGTTIVVVEKDTTFRLTAFDARGLKTSQEITVKVKVESPPENVPPLDPPASPTSTTAGPSTAGGGGGRNPDKPN